MLQCTFGKHLLTCQTHNYQSKTSLQRGTSRDKRFYNDYFYQTKSGLAQQVFISYRWSLTQVRLVSITNYLHQVNTYWLKPLFSKPLACWRQKSELKHVKQLFQCRYILVLQISSLPEAMYQGTFYHQCTLSR